MLYMQYQSKSWFDSRGIPGCPPPLYETLLNNIQTTKKQTKIKLLCAAICFMQ